jgi:predicted transcriptional regulator
MSAQEKRAVSITFKTESQKRQFLDEIAAEMDRDRSYILNEAINNYLELHRWQVKQLEKGVAVAEAGDFSTEEEIQAAIAKWTT